MMESNFLTNKIKKATLTTLVSLSLCGCFELGEFEDDQHYFDTFPSVQLMEKDKNSKSYDVDEYFYTEEGINDFISNIPYREYLYLFVKVEEDFLLNELNLSFCSENDCMLEISVFLLDDIPSDIRGYDDPTHDEENNLIEYDDPQDAMFTKNIHLNASSWTSSYLIDYPRGQYIEVTKGQYIALRFENNSYVGKEKGLPLATFTTTNLLIRAQGS